MSTIFQFKRAKTPSRSSIDSPALLAEIMKRGLEREIQRSFANASSVEREKHEESAQIVLKHLSCSFLKMGSHCTYRPNQVNEALKQREAQLMAVIASYNRELERWGSINEVVGKEAKLQTPETPETETAVVGEPFLRAEKVLASSTKALKLYVLQTDHIQSTLKQIENRTNMTEWRVRELAASLNDKVIEEFGVTGDADLVPPTQLTTVKTNDLNVSVLEKNSTKRSDASANGIQKL